MFYDIEEDEKQQEATQRNNALVSLYGSLPSYAYFTREDIKDEESNITWWNSFYKDTKLKEKQD